MRLYNYHTHTQYCDGHNTVAEMAKAAVDQGFEVIGFTPHSPIIIPSPCNMKAEDVPAYLDDVRRANEMYAPECRFLAGMEIDYLDKDFNASSQYFVDLDLDFAISSVHFIPAQGGEYIDIDGKYERFARNMREHFHDDLRYVVNTYFSQSMDMLHQGGFTILGHFDKIALNGAAHDPDLEQHGWYIDLVQDYIREIEKSGVTIEINTKAKETFGRFFPNELYWPQLVEARVPIVVNSDAHYADRLNASRGAALQRLAELGYAVS